MKSLSTIAAICISMLVCLSNRSNCDAQSLGEDFPACSRRDPNLGKCIRDSIYKLKPKFASGELSPDFKIDPLDPFYLPSFTIGGRTDITKITFSDIYISRATDFNLKDIRASYDDGYLKVMPHVELDRVDVKTKYRWNALPFAPIGEAHISLLNLKVHGDARVRLSKRNGTEYAKVEQAKLMFDRIRAGNLKFSIPLGGPKIHDAPRFVNAFMRLFSEPVVKVVYKLLEKPIDKVHIDVVNEFIKDIPATFFLSE